jgi:hypothetical protein
MNDTTFLEFLGRRFGGALSATHPDVLTSAIMHQAVGDMLRACAAEPHRWEGALVCGFTAEEVEAGCDAYFAALGLTPGAAMRGGRGATKIYRDDGPDGHAYRCTAIEIFGGIFVAARVCELKLTES